MTTTTIGDKIAKALLDIQAVALKPHDPFIWASGMRSPIYCDNRLTISYPEIRDMIADGFVELIREHYGDVDVIAGAATGGVPHAAWVAQKLGKPMIYVRSSAKKHGKGNMIEGVLHEGQTVVVIEDLISTGGSVLNVVEGVRDAGGQVAGVAAIFSYEFQKATDNFRAAACKFATLSTYSQLLPIAVQENYVSADDLELLSKWKDAPDQF
ncbi:orotate phosphoribosyltransferase [Tumebacillus permanentifrigoris]|uniref:Orotate phosphoribosyltransferase n=1 Tax=Tumebacillus permanentifrigoris TaxID=378543 RepID=A0A316D8F4_9BACL|nr:orotate phosphoribosyltransferase [Tumebacillus permanentifrigoris]PWK12857.1 orotate phosphoribosyltransferase [Tumebacillus permanentifrigoris]